MVMDFQGLVVCVNNLPRVTARKYGSRASTQALRFQVQRRNHYTAKSLLYRRSVW